MSIYYRPIPGLRESTRHCLMEMANSGSSESHSVAGALYGIAENGEEMATDGSLYVNAEEIISAAKAFITQLHLPKGKEITQAVKITTDLQSESSSPNSSAKVLRYQVYQILDITGDPIRKLTAAFTSIRQAAEYCQRSTLRNTYHRYVVEGTITGDEDEILLLVGQPEE